MDEKVKETLEKQLQLLSERSSRNNAYYADVLSGVKGSTLEESINVICGSLVGKGLSFRQAAAILDIAKDRLKDARI